MRFPCSCSCSCSSSYFCFVHSDFIVVVAIMASAVAVVACFVGSVGVSVAVAGQVFVVTLGHFQCFAFSGEVGGFYRFRVSWLGSSSTRPSFIPLSLHRLHRHRQRAYRQRLRHYLPSLLRQNCLQRKRVSLKLIDLAFGWLIEP